MSCLGVSECFPLAFGVPAVLMLCATGIFVAGYKLYKITPPTGNVLSQVMGVIRVALARKRMTPRSERIAYVHWLDYAVPTVGAHTVVEIKSLFSVLYMFLPLPFFWTLFDQQSSFWVEQAQKMKVSRCDASAFRSIIHF